MNIRSEIRPELWDAISQHYEAEHYTNAILAAFHYLRDILRDAANIDGDGTSLVGQALGGNPPRLQINKFETESQKDEQRGFEQILRGLYQGIRNPRTHEIVEDKKEHADTIIVFINYILGIISKAKGPFALEEWLERVFDPDFVASERYAQLLAAEVPPKKLNEALIAIYRGRVAGDGERLSLIFHALIKLRGEDKINELLATISSELKVASEDKGIWYTLQMLPPHLWTRIDETARLRIENKLIRSVEVGTVNSSTRRSTNGALGTWARDFAEYFTLKDELYNILLKKLSGDSEEQAYVALFFWPILPHTLTQPVNDYTRNRWVNAICQAVSSPRGPSIVREKLLDFFYSFPEDWQALILKKLKPLEDEDPDFYASLVNSEIPF